MKVCNSKHYEQVIKCFENKNYLLVSRKGFKEIEKYGINIS